MSKILDNVTTTGAKPGVKVQSGANVWKTNARTLYLTGTLGTGLAVAIEISVDGTNWVPIYKTDGNALVLSSSLQSANMTARAHWIRANITAGTGFTIDLDML